MPTPETGEFQQSWLPDLTFLIPNLFNLDFFLFQPNLILSFKHKFGTTYCYTDNNSNYSHSGHKTVPPSLKLWMERD